jgi:uncharacterized coiled-coil protein SlyX
MQTKSNNNFVPRPTSMERGDVSHDESHRKIPGDSVGGDFSGPTLPAGDERTENPFFPSSISSPSSASSSSSSSSSSSPSPAPSPHAGSQDQDHRGPPRQLLIQILMGLDTKLSQYNGVFEGRAIWLSQFQAELNREIAQLKRHAAEQHDRIVRLEGRVAKQHDRIVRLEGCAAERHDRLVRLEQTVQNLVNGQCGARRPGDRHDQEEPFARPLFSPDFLW